MAQIILIFLILLAVMEKQKNQNLIVLNPLRKIEFYGFDITSPAISNKTMFF